MQPRLTFISRITSGLVLTSTVALGAIAGLNQASAADRALTPDATNTLATPNSGTLLAQQVRENIVVFDTRDFAVRVFEDENGQTRMNVFDRSANPNLLRVNGQPATFTVRDGKPVYLTAWDYSGQQADYIVELFPNQFARLVIVSGSGNVLASQDADSVSAFDVPGDAFEQVRQDNILAFETSSYAVRVFQRDGQRFMNVFNKFTQDSELNGKAASLVDPVSPYEDAVSYVASGQRQGQQVRYFARIDGQGRTILEIENINGQRLFQEPGTGPVIVNIPPSDLPEGVGSIDRVNDAYVAAVFGGESTLAEVQREFPEAFIDTSSRQGDFINAGTFATQDEATLRVLELRSAGFSNARVVFRDVRYR